MSETILRPTTEDDLPALSELTDTVFGRRRDPRLLRWLLLADEPGLPLESKVATREGRIVGHVAVLLGHYRWQGGRLAGSHPLLYMVAPGSRGRAGVRLRRWCLGHGDFTMIVGGTPTSQSILAKRHFAPAARAVELRMPTVAPGAAERRDVELSPYDATAITEAPAAGPLRHIADEPILRWLAACPELEAQLFTLRRAGKAIGPVLLYVDRGVDPARGRIVHLPWSSDDPRQLLGIALDQLETSGCPTASILATHPSWIAAVRELGGEIFYERRVFCRCAPSGRVAGEQLAEESDWYLSYLEGDLAYRRL